LPIHVIIWQYDIEPAMRGAFEAAYGPDGAWAALFRTGDGYLGTRLFRDTIERDSYATFDYWRSAAAFEAFKRDQRAAYAALDEQCSRLTLAERYIGSCDWDGDDPAVPPAARP
jgi:heme-degrading monooxygenase HmoA